jgi:hypothetical protein
MLDKNSVGSLNLFDQLTSCSQPLRPHPILEVMRFALFCHLRGGLEVVFYLGVAQDLL